MNCAYRVTQRAMLLCFDGWKSRVKVAKPKTEMTNPVLAEQQ